MHITSESLTVGRCYRTTKAEVLKIVSFDGSRVITLSNAMASARLGTRQRGA
jgi:hypothetical protein